MAEWNTPARNAAIAKGPCDQNTGGSFVTVGRDNIRREDVARPTRTEAARGRRPWMSSAGHFERLHRCPSIGPVLLHELTFAFVLNNAIGSPACFQGHRRLLIANLSHRSPRQRPPRLPAWQSRTPRNRCRRGVGT
jgi:hypothetical protein